MLNEAVVFLAALVPLAEKLTAAGGVPVVAQLYVKVEGSQVVSPARTEIAVVVPETGFGPVPVGVDTVGPGTVPVSVAAVPLSTSSLGVTDTVTTVPGPTLPTSAQVERVGQGRGGVGLLHGAVDAPDVGKAHRIAVRVVVVAVAASTELAEGAWLLRVTVADGGIS